MNPMSLFTLNLHAATMMAQASSVMAIRMFAMGGVIPARRGENKRMVDEKTNAMSKSFAAGTSAMIAGKAPVEVMEQALKPISKRVSANHKRLTKR